MRYSVQYQDTTGEWVIFDTQIFTMVGICRTEEEAMLEALRLDERDRVQGIDNSYSEHRQMA